jgi:hypothetical protein
VVWLSTDDVTTTDGYDDERCGDLLRLASQGVDGRVNVFFGALAPRSRRDLSSS